LTSVKPFKPAYTSSTSSPASNIRATKFLNTILAIYTITFTLLLLPLSVTQPLEASIIFITSLSGWTLIYLESLKRFLQHPRQYALIAVKNVELEAIQYFLERWNTYQLIRERNPYLHSNRSPPANLPLYKEKMRLRAEWKEEILESMKKHNLRDYIRLRPTERNIQKGISPSKTPVTEEIMAPIKEFDPAIPTKGMDSISAEEASPIKTEQVQDIPTMLVTVTSEDDPSLSADSKQTIVDTTLSPREKVPGFIHWEALKRDDDPELGHVRARRALSSLRAHTTGDTSTSSYEREGLEAEGW
jgi:hypothetical protein